MSDVKVKPPRVVAQLRANTDKLEALKEQRGPLVDEARAAGATWQMVADALGMTQIGAKKLWRRWREQ